MSAVGVLAANQAASTGASVTFWILAIIAVAAAVGLVLAPRAVHGAVLLAVVMLSLAVLYAVAGAPFLAFVQIIVYTGAVLMLFLFVLMIVGVSAADSMRETIRGQRLAAGVAAIALLVLLALVVGHATIGPPAPDTANYGVSNVQRLATLIFTRYVFPFEVTSALLITAALGAMVLAHRERTTPRPTQRELARERVASGQPAPLPGPGVYARHNAADLPALLPDGTPAKLSLNPVMVSRARAAVQPPGGVVAGTLPAAADGPDSGDGGNGNAGPESNGGAGENGSGPSGGAAPSGLQGAGAGREDTHS